MPQLSNTDPLLLSPTGIQTNSFLPTANTAYKRGDLLTVSADGVLTHSADSKDWHVVCLEDCTTEQSDKHVASQEGIPVYTQADLNLDAVSIAGVLLADAQKVSARAHSAISTSINLRKPFKTGV